MYGNGYSMAIVLDHRSTATSLTGNSMSFGNHVKFRQPNMYLINLIRIEFGLCQKSFGKLGEKFADQPPYFLNGMALIL